ncbi:hypothetical protein CHLNCDRAFT_142491 [Chlorella variabilis]|uniref:SET domain-containing protein n=1 Tax=Chlorella variabilis TaxID=554065 RepID=E1ZTR9_CHLVA|nr:hypothetical protein CHLNCDRAFT_142491 [Chlorella variabilis]EFN50775.1 hypothetical protein CHLNCDRAFT_142491 [Chlorella variabilis]|eukprot:XP_005842887.1 hypothetical protein CHLNCDRAFT_142491 [Chlorella variabilis]
MDRGRRSLAAEVLRRRGAPPAQPAGPRFTQLTLDGFLHQPASRPAAGAASSGGGTQDPPPPPLEPAAPGPAAPQPAATPLEAARRAALQSFWSLLADFEALGCAPASWNGYKAGRPCATCERGAFATKDLKPDEVIVSLPFKAVLRLKDLDHAAFPAEYARHLLAAMHNEPSHNATWGVFWETQPGPEGVFTPEVYTDEHLALLQCPELEGLARGQRHVTEQIYDGSYPHATLEPFVKTVPADKVSPDIFKYVSSLVGSRYFGFYRDADSEKVASHLLPLLDAINHDDDPNAWRSDDGDNVLITATKPIKKGEEITFNYQPNIVHRADMSLYIYGFVIQRDQPLLCAVDLPGFDPKDPFGPTPQDDADYELGGKLATRAELDRLSARLAAAGTSEAEDQALLQSGTVTDWRHKAILEFRVMRKRALRQTIAKLTAALGLDGGGAPELAQQRDDEDEDDDEEEVEAPRDEL